MASLPPAHDKNKADELIGQLCDHLKAQQPEASCPDGDSPRWDTHRVMASFSPYLSSLMRRRTSTAAALVVSDHEALFKTVLDSMAAQCGEATSLANVMAAVRQAKQDVALITAHADISEAWTLEQVTGALSTFAAASLDWALCFLLWQRMTKDQLAWPEQPLPFPDLSLKKRCGFFVLGMGKLGAEELNYSSDIDLIALFDLDRVSYTGQKDVGDFFVRLTRDLIKIMSERTGDGYVFRTDLRLRPDPGATPLALSTQAAETYYQSLALTWERAAMIKARVVAGDEDAGNNFLDVLSPFVWRRSMDFAALEDIQIIKDQIHRFHGHGAPRLPGLDIKLGPGGIREIEFYTQINQLLFGGRDPSLQVRGTFPALDQMVRSGRLDPAVRDDLTTAYRLYRRIEHRLQMVNDQQTHCLPDGAEDLDHVARFCGYADQGAMAKALRPHLKAVQLHYDGLLPDSSRDPRLVGDRLTHRLEELGLDCDSAEAIIDRWRRGRYRATRSERSRRLLEGCLAPLLDALTQTSEPDQALARMDAFLSRLPAGVQLFALFQSNPDIFQLFARIMGTAPALAETLSRKTHLLDNVLEPGFFEPLPGFAELRADLQNALQHADYYEEKMDEARRWLADQQFRLGVHVLEAIADVDEAARCYSNLAEAVLTTLVPVVEDHYAERYGRFAGGHLGIIAMGKFGGQEMSILSDLDLVMLYKTDGKTEVSDGQRQVPASRYFSGLASSLITALSALTAEGRLYEVDTRLRPSGNQGPLAVTLDTFEEYYREQAWTWEHMALTRARVVHGDSVFASALGAIMCKALVSDRDHDSLVCAVAQMRRRLFEQFGTENPWSIKHCRGGLLDIEFICQYLMLRSGSAEPGIFTPRLVDALARLQEVAIIDGLTANRLRSAWHLLMTIQGILRLCVGENPDPATFSPDLRTVLCRATGIKRWPDLKNRLLTTQQEVHALYHQYIDDPAAALENCQGT